MSEVPSQALLSQKLGLKENARNLVINAPEGFIEQFEGSGIIFLKKKPVSVYVDYIHLFTTSLDGLKKNFPKYRKLLKKDGALWISWPKKSAKVKTDLDEMIVIKTGLSFGLVDVKVVSVDEVWSALKFVYRTKDR